jgi:hypothetical protein
MTVSDADRFTKMIKPAKPNNTAKATGTTKSRIRDDGSMSAIEAAYKVLTETKRAMNAREIYETAVEQGYCKLAGATPILTVSAILHLDIKNKGEASRFQKTGRGLFAAR